MLTEITIRRFRNLNELTLPLSPLNVLVGANSSGKTSVLQGIQFASSLGICLERSASLVWEEDAAEAVIGADELFFRPQANVFALAHNTDRLPNDPTHGICVRFTEAKRACMFEVFASGKHDLGVRVTGESLFSSELSSVVNPYTVIVPGLAGLALEESLAGLGAVRRAATCGDGSRVLRSILKLLLASGKKWDRFLDDLHEVFPQVGFSLLTKEEYDATVDIAVSSSAEGRRAPIDSAGTGFLQAVQILSYVHLFDPDVLLLDEPDAHLHPNNQRLMATMLRKLSEDRGKQVILSTHSRHLLDAFAGSANMLWLRDGQLVPCQQSQTVRVLMDLGALDRGDLLKAGKVRCVVLAEDANSSALQAVLAANGFQLATALIWPYKGCRNLNTLHALVQVITDLAPAVRVLVHRDRDYMEPCDVRLYRRDMAELLGAHVHVFVTAGTDIEAALLATQHVTHCVPAVKKGRAAALITEATVQGAKDSIQRFTNAVVQKAQERYSKRRTAKPPNAGKLSDQCRDRYARAPLRFRRGKNILGHLTALLQKEVGKNVRLLQPSPALKCQELTALAVQIWPPDNAV